jgi:hypothetical protein
VSSNGAHGNVVMHIRGQLCPNPSLQPTCYGWLRQPAQAAELKR